MHEHLSLKHLAAVVGEDGQEVEVAEVGLFQSPPCRGAESTFRAQYHSVSLKRHLGLSGKWRNIVMQCLQRPGSVVGANQRLHKPCHVAGVEAPFSTNGPVAGLKDFTTCRTEQ